MDVLGKAACEAKALELRKVLGKPAKLFIEWLIGAPAGTSLTRKIPARAGLVFRSASRQRSFLSHKLTWNLFGSPISCS